MNKRQIILQKVRVNNLKNVDLTLEPFQFIVFTGVSGSGKSSLAFDTIHAEGQRRFIESLPHSFRRYLKELPKPEVGKIEGLPPTIAVEQKGHLVSPRSTVGTVTGIYDYLRVLFAKIAIPYCPISNKPIEAQSRDKIIKTIENLPENSTILILAPYVKSKKGEFKELFSELLHKGFTRLRIDGKIEDLSKFPNLDPKKMHNMDIVIDRLTINKESSSRVKEAVISALEIGEGTFSMLNEDEETLFSEKAYSPDSGLSYKQLNISDFSFNHPDGMCEECLGLGETWEFDIRKIINNSLSITEDCCLIAPSYKTVLYGNIYRNLARIVSFDINDPWEKLSDRAKDVFLNGLKQKWTPMYFTHPTKKKRWREYVRWEGVLAEAKRRYREASSLGYKQKIEELMIRSTCSSCLGTRLKPYPRAARVQGKRIAEITAMTMEEAFNFFSNFKLSEIEKIIAEDLIKEIKKRLELLINVGLHYLTIDRITPSLSGGEMQRVKLASQIGCGLAGTVYILDEPSIGLHPHDQEKLLNTLHQLKENKNTIIVIEHDKETMLAADTIVDIGPGAGKFGGEIVAVGDSEVLKKKENSLTGKYLAGKLQIRTKEKKRIPSSFLTICKASHNNLKSIDVKIPLNCFLCITGVSGSGKSSLIADTLYPALFNLLNEANMKAGKHEKIINAGIKKVILVDQSPVGKTSRSNPATYVKLFDEIRELFSSTREAKSRGYTKSHFSFNEKYGACPYCLGLGEVKIDLDFMENASISCPQCNGKKFDPSILSIKFKDKTISDILKMDVKTALSFFRDHPQISSKLKTLEEVGLDYLELGQPTSTLSGGEAERIKLTRELSKVGSNILYILDEPTTGLHFADIQKLIDLLNSLIALGNSIVVIEHNVELIKTADWIIDLGPGAGKEGGYVVGEGTPKDIAKLNTKTGISLRNKGVKKVKSAPHLMEKAGVLKIEGACQNNLKNISIEIPLQTITAFTGPSGSGKTSLAFETIYAEGERRYIEALPPYIRSFLHKMAKPKVEKIEGLCPTIAIEQRGHAINPRSTVGTLTEIYDLLRIIYAHLGIAFCPETKERIQAISEQYVADKVLSLKKGTKVNVLSPVSPYSKESFSDFTERLNREGFVRIRLNKTYYELEEKIPFSPNLKNEIYLVIDRFMVNGGIEKRLLEAIKIAKAISNNIIVVDLEREDLYFNLAFASIKTGKSYPPLTPQTFSFNSEQGMCPNCQGLGYVYGTTYQNLINRSPIFIFKALLKKKQNQKNLNFLVKRLNSLGIDPFMPLVDMAKEKLELFLHGEKEGNNRYRGILEPLAKLGRSGKTIYRKPLLPFMEERSCPECRGERLNPLARNVELNGYTISRLLSLSIDELFLFMEKLPSEKPFLQETLSKIKNSLKFLSEIGLGYLSLNRTAPTLSGGEIERLHLAKEIGLSLASCLYIIDEPTIGLHPHDGKLLMDALKKLKNLGNSIILVEHDPAIIEEADFICDFGYGAGNLGGLITAKGTVKEIKNNSKSLTGNYLSHKKSVAIPKNRRKSSQFLLLKNARLNNLKNLSLSIPLGVILCVTGVSGSGKSTLIKQFLKEAIEKRDVSKVVGLEQIDKLIFLDQRLGTQTSRSDVGTYSDVMPLLRSFFSSLKEAKAKGLTPRFFSANDKSGMCKSCFGLGFKNVDLQYLPPVKVVCESCQGFRLNPLSLSIKYKDKNFGQIMELTVDEAFNFFEFIPKLMRKLEILISLGLGYLKLGQETNSLSGGEIQRIRLSNELTKTTKTHTLYIFDEPSIGLHEDDLNKLLPIFHKIVDRGNSLIIIEHNVDIIKNADYIIDLGPGAGINGGEIMFAGPFEEFTSKNAPRSKTVHYT